MAVERREKDGGGGGRGGKDRNLNLVDVYDIAADIGKVRDHGVDGVGEDEEIPSLVDVYDIAVDIGKVSGEQKGPQTIFFSSSGIQNLSFSNNLWMFGMDNDANSNIDNARMKPNMNL